MHIIPCFHTHPSSRGCEHEEAILNGCWQCDCSSSDSPGGFSWWLLLLLRRAAGCCACCQLRLLLLRRPAWPACVVSACGAWLPSNAVLLHSVCCSTAGQVRAARLLLVSATAGCSACPRRCSQLLCLLVASRWAALCFWQRLASSDRVRAGGVGAADNRDSVSPWTSICNFDH